MKPPTLGESCASRVLWFHPAQARHRLLLDHDHCGIKRPSAHPSLASSSFCMLASTPLTVGCASLAAVLEGVELWIQSLMFSAIFALLFFAKDSREVLVAA
jgi:hypothetical protein